MNIVRIRLAVCCRRCLPCLFYSLTLTCESVEKQRFSVGGLRPVYAYGFKTLPSAEDYSGDRPGGKLEDGTFETGAVQGCVLRGG